VKERPFKTLGIASIGTVAEAAAQYCGISEV